MISSTTAGAVTSELRRPFTSLRPRGWSRPQFAAAVMAAFAAPALLTASQQYYAMQNEGQPMRWRAALVGQLVFWYGWCALAPVAVWMTRGVARLARGLTARFALLVVAGVVASLLHSAIIFVVRSALSGPPPGARAIAFTTYARGWLAFNLVIFAALACATFAAENYGRYREREVVAATLTAQLSQAQLRALRMQLQPHFLFNALNSIAMLVRKGEDGQAVKMLVGLSDLLRHVLDDHVADEISLREELEFLGRYLAIEQTRFQDRLTVRFDVDGALLEAYVPNLILQPLVENAIRHGIARRAAAGTIEVGATRSDGTLTLSVRDDGPGVAHPPGGTDGVGLRNTRERLARLYGSRASVTLGDAEGGGAMARLTMPYRTTPTAGDAA